MLPFSELVTASFYGWEIRGRGWQLADYPVSLEPPYRPFFLIPDASQAPRQIDDGKRPTVFSALVENAKRFLEGTRVETVAKDFEPFEEQPPYPAEPRTDLVTFALRVPALFPADLARAEQLLAALSASLQPVSLEWIGVGGHVSMQLTCDKIDAEYVRETLIGHVPEATVISHPDMLLVCWNPLHEQVIVDVGLANEFFLPLASVRNFKADPYIPLISALAQAKEDECAALQVIFERVRNPWARSTLDALSDGEGGCIIEDAPEFLRLAREKTETPLFAAVVRIATSAATRERAWELARAVGGFHLQFARPDSNELIPLEQDGYPEELREQALLERTSYRTGMLLSIRELVGLVHLPDASMRHPALLRQANRTKAAAPETRGHALLLGENLHRGKREVVTLAIPDRLQHTHVIGTSGTGKSTLLVNMILQDIAAGIGVAIFDPHGDLVDDVLARIPEKRVPDVVLFDPADEEWPIGFNILSARTERERTLLASDLVGIFERLSTSWGDTMTAVLANAALAMLKKKTGGTLLDLRRFLVDDGFRRSFLANVADEDVHFFWEREYPLIGTRAIGPLLTRLDSFLRMKVMRNIVGQRGARLDLAEVMDEGGIFLAKLSQGLIGVENAALIGSLLVSKFHQLALARQAVPKIGRRPFFLYADECQHFVTPSMAALLSEGRKYGLGLVLAHQTLAQLKESEPVESALLGVLTRIVFRVGDDDARKLADGFSFFEAADMKNLGRGEAIIRVGAAANDCNLATFPLPAVSEEESELRSGAILAQSRAKYGTPLAELQARFEEWYPRKPESKLERVEEPVKGRAPEPEAALSLPIDLPAPVLDSALPRRTRPEPRVRPKPPPLGRGGQEHKYLQHLIKRLGEERGFRAVVEEPVPEGKVDVVLRKEAVCLAFEISVTTEIAHELANARKCLSGGFTQVFLVSRDVRRREKFARSLKSENSTSVIEVLAPEEIVAVLERYASLGAPAESTVRGYKVKVTRQALSYQDMAGRRSAVAEVIARSLKKGSKGRSD